MPPAWLVWLAVLFALAPAASYILLVATHWLGVLLKKIFGEETQLLPTDRHIAKPIKIMLGVAAVVIIILLFVQR